MSVSATSTAGGLPAGLRLLFVSAVEPSWISLALNLDAAGCHEPQFRWCSSPAEALALLRDASFDCILLSAGQAERTDALATLRGMRAAGNHEPVVWVADVVEGPHWIDLCGLDAEVLIAPLGWESPALVAVMGRAIARGELLQNNHRLSVAHDRRISRERDEAARLLLQQRQMVQGLACRPDDQASAAPVNVAPASPEADRSRDALPAAVRDYYHELLRTYVIMGSGNLGTEIARLAELVCTAGLAPREVLELHLERVETLVRGLGNRSTRHVMVRADLLALELMMHVGEFYRSLSKRSGSAELHKT